MKRHPSSLIAGGLDLRQLGDAALRAGRWLGRAADSVREAHLRAAEERRQREAAEDFAYDKALARFEVLFAEARRKHVNSIDFAALGEEIDKCIAAGPRAIADYCRPIVDAHYKIMQDSVSQAGFPSLDKRRIRKRLKPIAGAAVGELNRDVFGQFDLYYLRLNPQGVLMYEDTWARDPVLPLYKGDREYIGSRTGYNYGRDDVWRV